MGTHDFARLREWLSAEARARAEALTERMVREIDWAEGLRTARAVDPDGAEAESGDE
jgi:hypothetical protein